MGRDEDEQERKESELAEERRVHQERTGSPSVEQVIEERVAEAEKSEESETSSERR